jgi:magnesium-transporting ATPase (P-type)
VLFGLHTFWGLILFSISSLLLLMITPPMLAGVGCVFWWSKMGRYFVPWFVRALFVYLMTSELWVGFAFSLWSMDISSRRRKIHSVSTSRIYEKIKI